MSLNKSTLTAAQRQQLYVRMNELTNLSLARFRSAVRAIYAVNKRGFPDHEGSCILLDIYGSKILLTAAHVADVNIDQNYTLCVTGEKELIQLDGMQFHLSPKVNGRRRDDHFDFAFALISPALEAQLGQGYVTERDIMYPNPHVDITGHLFTTIGYPNTKNKSVDPLNFKIKTSVFPYSSTARSNKILKKTAGHDGSHHIFIGYDKFSRAQNGQKAFSIKPNGLSGGALIWSGNISDISVFSGAVNPPPKVAALIVEEWRQHKVLVSTRLWSIVEKAIIELNILIPAQE